MTVKVSATPKPETARGIASEDVEASPVRSWIK